jgi:Helix-turn-helix domain
MQEIIQMSKKELDRVHVIRKLLDKQITQHKAAELLGLQSDRQVRNLVGKFKKHGDQGLVSRQRGKPSNRSFDQKFKKQVMALVKEKYPDFGPTFAAEKLAEYHDIQISDETLRKWMIEHHLWISRSKRSRIHPQRPRREYFGELIQIDGSHHYWFEDRAGKCVLIVFIDDATSKITSLYFCASECLQAYFTALEAHVKKYGRPMNLYSDRHSIFGGSERIQHAQFIRAIRELDIESILARSPQAKGRVERVNQTLQDRLVKEMRLRNISTLDDANHYALEYMEEHNAKFSKEPRGQFDAHRPLDSGYDLERSLTRCETRTISKDLSFSFNSINYQIVEEAMINRLRNKKIEIRQKLDGTFRIFYDSQELKYLPVMEYVSPQRVLDCKEKLVWNQARGNYPRTNHPWKKYGYQIPLSNHLARPGI